MMVSPLGKGTKTHWNVSLKEMNFICIFQVNLIKQIYTLLSNFFQITIYHGYLHKLVQRVSNFYLFCTVYTQIHIHTLTYDFCIT